MVEIITYFRKIQLKDINAKEYFAILIAILFLTNLVIFLNIPFLRQILGFISFTIIPGLLILYILKLNKIEFLKKFVLSVGLSIVFLIFEGLVLNSFYPLITKPLSLPPLLISVNILLVTMTLIAYKRNKDDFNIKHMFNFKLDLKDKLTSILIFPILLPFMAVLGTYLMNTRDSNIILLVMLFLIPAYVFAIVILRDSINEVTYPIAVLMIATALSLMYGLRSNNLPPADSSIELYTFKLAFNNAYWNISKFYHNYNACLSITILPTIYKIFLGISDKYVYKIIYNIIGSILPLCGYSLFRKYLDPHHAFLSSFFFMAQYIFISMLGWIIFRQIIALLFFNLAILIFFDDEIDILGRKILFIIFMFSVIVSHYSTAFIFFILMFSFLFASNIKERLKLRVTEKRIRNMTYGSIVLFFISIFFWYNQITSVLFTNVILFLKENLINLSHLSLEEIFSQRIFVSSKAETIPEKINFIIHNISFIFITIGVFSSIKNYKNSKLDEDFILMNFLCFSLLAFLVVISTVLIGYGPDRIYLQLLIFLAPAFVIGGETISKFISRFNIKSNLSLVIIPIVLIAQFFSSTYIIYQFFGIHYSEALNSDGIRYENFYVHDKDINGAKWIHDHNVENLYAWSDYPGTFIYRQFNPELVRVLYSTQEIGTGYIYLRTVNNIEGNVYHTYGNYTNIADYSHLFINKNKIYANGGSTVYNKFN